MPDMSLPCSCCGYVLTLREDISAAICPACGMRTARPRPAGPSLDALSRAIRLRLACDFAGAERSYQQVLLDHPDAHEALWGRLLCHYGVEYVEDPRTGTLTPTVHSVRRKPMQAQQDFLDACHFAPEELRRQYERDAAYIDQAQAAIRQRADSCPPYDVFICHKATKPDSSEKTEDFHRAFQLFTYLEKQGMRPFFAPECLQGMAGADYEAGIYHALETARVMLVICSDPAYLASPWVRSEWSRYLQLVDEDEHRHIVPLLYDRFDAYTLPAEFRYRRLQGLVMGELTSTQTLTDMLHSRLGTQPPQSAAPTPAPAPQPAAPVFAPRSAPEIPVRPQPAPSSPASRASFVPRSDPWASVDDRYQVGRIISCRVCRIGDSCAYVSLQPGVEGVVALPECSAQPVRHPGDALQVGQLVRAKILEKDVAVRHIALSIRLAESGAPAPQPVRPAVPASQPAHTPPAPPAPAQPDAPQMAYTAQELFTASPSGHGCIITRYTGKAPAVRIPPSINGRPVLAIGAKAFRKLKHLQSVVIPEGVTEIGDHALEACKCLSAVQLPASLRILGKYALAQNPSLQSIRLPEGLQVIHQAAFWASMNLREINIPPQVDIRTDAFLLCAKLSRQTVQEIDRHTKLSAKLGFRR